MCSVCNEVLEKGSVIPSKNEHPEHTYGDWKVVKEATCNNDGEQRRYCSGCEMYETQIIKALGHSEVVDKAVEATCTTAGKTEGKHCSVCNTVLVAQTEVPANGHKWDNGTVTTQPTDGKAGVKTYTCTVCKETKTETEEIPALKHEHKYTDVVTAPTCTEKGYTTHTCACGDTYKDSEVPAIGHTEKLVNAVEPTETTEGYTGDTVCSVCKETLKKGEVIPATGTSADVLVGDVDRDGTVTAKDATQILRYINGKSSVFTANGTDTALIEKIADVDGDGSVTAKDATQILRYINGKTSVFEKLNK